MPYCCRPVCSPIDGDGQILTVHACNICCLLYNAVYRSVRAHLVDLNVRMQV